jgi:hypothetical protein
MTKPIPDKAEVAVEYPDKLYIGTFERSSRFDAHLDATGLSLTLTQSGDAEVRKSIRMHLNYQLFASILHEVAKTAADVPSNNLVCRQSLRVAAEALCQALRDKTIDLKKPGHRHETHECSTDDLTPEEEVLLLHVLE